MSIFKQFETNQQKEVDGISITYAPNADGSIPTFIVARIGPNNIEFAKAIERETRPYQRLIDQKMLPKETDLAIGRKVFCSTVLKGWSNIQNNDGTEIKFNQESAIFLMEKLPDLYADLRMQAVDASNYKDAEMEAVTKN